MSKLRAPWGRTTKQRHTAQKSQESHTISGALAVLLAALQAMVLPKEIWRMPYLNDGAVATDAADSVGRVDAQSSPFDEVTRKPIMPHQGTVTAYVKELLELIGQRAYAILAALKGGTLTAEFVATTPAKGWRATSWRTKVLTLVAFVLEAVFGAKMAERLAGSHEYVSWAVGLAIAAVLTASALSIGHAIHVQQIGLLRGKGAWVALAVAVLGVVFLGLYSWGLGGGAEARPTGGGLRGGTAPSGNSGAARGHTENWALVLIYAALLLFLLASVVCSHLIDLYHEDVERVDKDVAAKRAVLRHDAQARLAIELLSQCLVLVEQAKHRARGLVHAYIGGVRRVLPPSLNSAWHTDSLENLDLPDPTWVSEIKAEIARLKLEDGQENAPDNPEPPLVLVRP